MAVTLKVDLQGDVRRCRSWPSADAAPSYAALQSTIRELFPDAPTELALRYKDDDGDVCSLVEASFSDAWATATAQGVFRLSAVTMGMSNASEVSAAASSVGWMVVEQEEDSLPASPGAGQPSSPVATQSEEQEQEQEQSLDHPEGGEEAVPQGEQQDSENLLQAEEAVQQQDEAEAAGPERVPTAAAAAAAGAAQQDRTSGSFCSAGAVEGLRSWGEGASSRLREAQPQVKKQVGSFTQLVIDDFKACRQDTKKALVGDSDENEVPTLRKVGNVVGFVVGLGVASRMVPIRATRLAVESVAAVSQGTPSAAASAAVDEEEAEVAEVADVDVASAPATESEEGELEVVEGGDELVNAPSTIDTDVPSEAATFAGESPNSQGTAAAGAAEGAANANSGMDQDVFHFGDQVKADFFTVRDEVRDVLGYVCGTRTTVGRQQEEPTTEGQEDSQQGGLRRVVPDIASNAVGFAVAAQLVPFRVLRLGIAGTTHGVNAIRGAMTQRQ